MKNGIGVYKVTIKAREQYALEEHDWEFLVTASNLEIATRKADRIAQHDGYTRRYIVA